MTPARGRRRRGPSRSTSRSTPRIRVAQARCAAVDAGSGGPPSGPSSRRRAWSTRRSKPRVLFTSRLISEMSGNLQVVHDRMVERGLDREHDLGRCSSPASPSAGASSTGCASRARWPAPTSSSSTTRSRRSTGSGCRRRSGSSSCGTRPARSRPSATAGSARRRRRHVRAVHKDYTAAIVSSDFDVPVLRRGVRHPRGHGSSRPASRGWTGSSTSGRRPRAWPRPARPIPETVGRPTILFAPTYRGDTIREASYDFELLDYAALHAVAVERDAVVIIKMHPFVLRAARASRRRSATA